jgi:hypothetical protein
LNPVDKILVFSLDFSEFSEGRRVKCFRKFLKGEELNHLQTPARGLAPIYTPRYFSEICVAFGTVYCNCQILP